MCHSKHVEPSINFGIINSITKLHLVGISTEYYNIIFLWDHRRTICGPSFAETSLCGAYLYFVFIYSVAVTVPGRNFVVAHKDQNLLSTSLFSLCVIAVQHIASAWHIDGPDVFVNMFSSSQIADYTSV